MRLCVALPGLMCTSWAGCWSCGGSLQRSGDAPAVDNPPFIVLEEEWRALGEEEFDARHGLGAHCGVGRLVALRDHFATSVPTHGR